MDKKYLNIYNVIVSKIESKEYQPNDKLPSEKELMDEYSVSRDTVRKSLNMLEQNGYCLIREKGSHFTYKNAAGNTIVVNKGINRMVARRLVKRYDLRV